MEIPNASVIGAIKELKVPYFCKKCKAQHRPGTKIWGEHLHEADTNRVSQAIRNKAIVIAKKEKREEREITSKFVKRSRSAILKNYSKLLQKLRPARYYYWEANRAYAYQLGSSDGYNTLEELMKDQKYDIDRAKKGESIAVIIRAAPYKIIKAKKVGVRE